GKKGGCCHPPHSTSIRPRQLARHGADQLTCDRVKTTGAPSGSPFNVRCTDSVSGVPGMTVYVFGEGGRLSKAACAPGNLPRKPGGAAKGAPLPQDPPVRRPVVSLGTQS